MAAELKYTSNVKVFAQRRMDSARQEIERLERSLGPPVEEEPERLPQRDDPGFGEGIKPPFFV